MSDLRQNFAVLENVSTKAGAPWHLVAELDAASGKNAGPVLAGIDTQGRLRYLKTNDLGELIMDPQSGDVARLHDAALTVGNLSRTKVASLTLQASKVYRGLGWVFGCLRTAEFEVVNVDDVGVTDVETELFRVLCGPGDINDANELENLEFTAGSTGTVELQVYATNLHVASDFRAAISALEIQN